MKSLPIDKLFHAQFYPHCRIQHLLKRHVFTPFKNWVTLKVVRDKTVSELANKYIATMLSDKQRYGYLYYLEEQTLLVPLDVRFNGHAVLDSADYDAIVKEIDAQALRFFQPQSVRYEITRVELLYFYVAIGNPHLNWITIDHLLKNNRRHAYLMTDLAKSL